MKKFLVLCLLSVALVPALQSNHHHHDKKEIIIKEKECLCGIKTLVVVGALCYIAGIVTACKAR